MLQSPSRRRADSTTPMLEKHRNTVDIERGKGADLLVEDDRRDDSVELHNMATKAVLPGAHAASQAAGGSGFDVTLQRELKRSTRKLDLARFRLTQVHKAGGDIARVTSDLSKVIDELSRFLLIADPAQLLDAVMSDRTKQARSAYLQKLQNFETGVKAGRGKHGWNLIAGGAGNLLCFGVGGAISTALAAPVMGLGSGIAAAAPFIGLGINTLAWTFAEPLISMMRATNHTNPYLDLYMVRQHLQARAAREKMDGTAGLSKNRKFAWTNASTRETEWLNASDWLARTSWLTLWSGKHFTDDEPYHIYSAAYGAANCLPELASASLYNKATWQGLGTAIGIRTAAGMIAGASLQECIQLLRASQTEHTGGREVVTRTIALWKEEAAWLTLLLADIENKQSTVGKDDIQKQAYASLRASVALWHEKATAKSAWTTSVLYEWRAMLQSKRQAMGIDPEVPGKRLDTAASFIGKAVSQLPGIAVGSLASRTARSVVPWIRWAGYLVPPLASIGAGGFVIRRELEASARVMMGAVHGLGRRCCGGQDAED
jgi:hypothetical protein